MKQVVACQVVHLSIDQRVEVGQYAPAWRHGAGKSRVMPLALHETEGQRDNCFSSCPGVPGVPGVPDSQERAGVAE